MEKWNPTQEAINNALRPKIIRRWLNAFLIIFLGLTTVSLIIYYKNDKAINSVATDESNNGKNIIENNEKSILRDVTKEEEPPLPTIVKPEDLTVYVNSSIVNSPNIVDMSVIIVDENEAISASISSSIAGLYNNSGKNGNTGLLRSSIIHKLEFKELIEGNSEVIERLKLIDHTDFLALGKIQSTMSKGSLIEGTSICRISLFMTIISTTNKSILKSFSFSVNGNGVTESQAREQAIEKLINTYYNDYLSL